MTINATAHIVAPFCVLFAVGMILLAYFLSLRVKKCSAKATVAKSAVSVCFILCWLVAAHSHMSNYAMFIGAGLVFGLLGDIWLDLKFCYKADEDFYTKMGFLSFAIGHLFFILAVATGTDGGFQPIALLPSAGVAAVAALVVFFGEKAMGLHYGEYKIISTCYGAVLFFTAAFAFFSALFGGFADNRHLVVMAIGGALFIISDLILSGTYFGEGKNRPVDIVTNHVTYYLAQFVIAGSVLFR